MFVNFPLLTKCWRESLLRRRNVNFAHSFEGFGLYSIGPVAVGQVVRQHLMIFSNGKARCHFLKTENERGWGRNQNLFQGYPSTCPFQWSLYSFLVPPNWALGLYTKAFGGIKKSNSSIFASWLISIPQCEIHLVYLQEFLKS